MGMKRIATGAAVSVAALALAGAGIANAIIADPTPASDYTMCGTVYADASSTAVADNHPAPDSGIPSTATPVSGVKVTGKLLNGGITWGTYNATTNANGVFCFTGNASMPAIIAAGGHVAFNAVTPLPSPYTTVVDTSHAGVINGTTFANHQVGGATSTKATGFNILVS